MTKRISFLIVITFLSTLLRAQNSLLNDKLEVQQAVARMFEDLSKRDSGSLKLDCTDDVTFYEHGQVWNIDTLINKAISSNTSIDFKRVNTFDFIYTEVDASTAWVTYRLNSVITKDNTHIEIHWLETVVLSKQHKQWKVKHLHSTLLSRS